MVEDFFIEKSVILKQKMGCDITIFLFGQGLF